MRMLSATAASVTQSTMPVRSSAARADLSTITSSAGRMPQPAMARYSPASAAVPGSCPSSRKSAPEPSVTGRQASPNIAEAQSPIRVTRRTCASSPEEAAEATIGITAQANPDPMMNSTKKSVPPSTSAASASTEYQPSITASVSVIANCARWLPTSGRPRPRTARKCWRYARGCGMELPYVGGRAGARGGRTVLALSGRWRQPRHRQAAGWRSGGSSARFISQSPQNVQSMRELGQIARPGGGLSMARRASPLIPRRGQAPNVPYRPSTSRARRCRLPAQPRRPSSPPEKPDHRVAIASLLERAQALGGRDGGALLPDDQRVIGDPAACQRRRERRLAQPLAIGRIEKDEVVGRTRVEAGPARVERQHPRRLPCPAARDVLAQEPQCLASALDEAGRGGPARQRLEAERAGPGEEIEHARPRDGIAIAARQHVEERLAHPVGGGAQMRGGIALAEACERAPAMRAADDPHASSALRSVAGSATRAGSAVFPASISRLPTM